jgi:hypothetical protein
LRLSRLSPHFTSTPNGRWKFTNAQTSFLLGRIQRSEKNFWTGSLDRNFTILQNNCSFGVNFALKEERKFSPVFADVHAGLFGCRCGVNWGLSAGPVWNGGSFNASDILKGTKVGMKGHVSLHGFLFRRVNVRLAGAWVHGDDAKEGEETSDGKEGSGFGNFGLSQINIFKRERIQVPIESKGFGYVGVSGLICRVSRCSFEVYGNNYWVDGLGKCPGAGIRMTVKNRNRKVVLNAGLMFGNEDERLCGRIGVSFK